MRCPSIPSPGDRRHRRLGSGGSPAPVTVLVAAALVLAPAPVGGQQEAAEVTRAREHYKKGTQAFQRERYDEAFQLWQAGYQLSGRPLFLLNMAHAERRRGQLHKARELYRRYLLVDPSSELRGDVEVVLADLEGAIGPEPEAAGPPTGIDPTRGLPPVGATALTRAPAPALPPPADAGLARGPEPTGRRPLLTRWWFWTGLGVAAAAGGASLFLLRGDRYTKMGSIGTVGSAR